MSTQPKLPGVNPDHIWQADHVLLLDGGIVLLKKRKKAGDRWGITVFERGGGSTHTGENSLMRAIKTAKSTCADYKKSKITRRLTIKALREVINHL